MSTEKPQDFTSSQTLYNTVWPARFLRYSQFAPVHAEFDLYPQKTGLAYQWPKLAKIDWRYRASVALLHWPAIVL